jgi:hypothetical protein
MRDVAWAGKDWELGNSSCWKVARKFDSQSPVLSWIPKVSLGCFETQILALVIPEGTVWSVVR